MSLRPALADTAPCEPRSIPNDNDLAYCILDITTRGARVDIGGPIGCTPIGGPALRARSVQSGVLHAYASAPIVEERI